MSDKKFNLFAAISSIFIGTGMLVWWGLSYFSGQIPELWSDPASIVMHLSAEALTALVLTISGVLLIKRSQKAQALALAGFGMLLYTLIQSPGYFIDKGQWLPVIMFALLFCLAIYVMIRLIKINH